MVHIYNGILLGHEIRPFAATWMQLEIIILSEVSQKEKDKYYVRYHLYIESKKIIYMNLYAERQYQRMLKLPHNCTHLTR